MKKFLFGPITAIMDKRTQMIQNSFDEAKTKVQEAEALQSEYIAHLDHADMEADKIIKAARNQAEIEYRQKMKDLEEETARIKTEANKAIALERQKQLQSAQEEIATIAILATTKIIQKNVDANTSKQMIGDFIKEVGVAK
jgi:F-type H+-transporting ATPase subunit b